eukprot:SAG31_NODE_441_length_15661_cov_17.905423_18_plen_306_part_00
MRSAHRHRPHRARTSCSRGARSATALRLRGVDAPGTFSPALCAPPHTDEMSITARTVSREWPAAGCRRGAGRLGGVARAVGARGLRREGGRGTLRWGLRSAVLPRGLHMPPHGGCCARLSSRCRHALGRARAALPHLLLQQLVLRVESAQLAERALGLVRQLARVVDGIEGGGLRHGGPTAASDQFVGAAGSKVQQHAAPSGKASASRSAAAGRRAGRLRHQAEEGGGAGPQCAHPGRRGGAALGVYLWQTDRAVWLAQATAATATYSCSQSVASAACGWRGVLNLVGGRAASRRTGRALFLVCS